MPKLLVETTGPFQLVDFDRSNPTMRHEGYTVVMSTNFVQERLALGQITIIAELNDEASDEEWLKYVAESDGDLTLARSSFCSSFGPHDGTPKSEKPAAPPATPPATPPAADTTSSGPKGTKV